MRFSYDTMNYDPAAPVALVTLSPLEGEGSIDNVPLLIDTGADTTILPIWAVHALGNVETGDSQFELEGFDGSISVASSVKLSLFWLGKRFRGQFLVLDQPHGILGRNILNNVTITLYGSRNEWDG
jgi:hypothetical protein